MEDFNIGSRAAVLTPADTHRFMSGVPHIPGMFAACARNLLLSAISGREHLLTYVYELLFNHLVSTCEQC